MDHYILSQILVIIAIGFYALTFLLKTKKLVLFVGLIGVVLNTISFVLLGAYTGAVVSAVAIIRSLWFFIEEKRDKRTWYSLAIVILLIIIATICTYKGVIDLLLLVAGVIYAFACWQKNISLYRWIGIATSVIYIIYDLHYKSFFGMASELISIICAVIGLILGLIKKRKEQTATNVVA